MGIEEPSELERVVETIRGERFPDLPQDLVLEILAAEEAMVEDRPAAVKRIYELIDSHVASKGSHASWDDA